MAQASPKTGVLRRKKQGAIYQQTLDKGQRSYRGEVTEEHQSGPRF